MRPIFYLKYRREILLDDIRTPGFPCNLKTCHSHSLCGKQKKSSLILIKKTEGACIW